MTAFIEWLVEELGRFVIAAISRFGYTGILLTMAIESACIPLPSEIIMPFSGYLVSTGEFSMLGVTLAGAFGNVLGSLVAYYAGLWGGRPFVERYGRYVLVSHHDLDLADRWFQKHGDAAVLVSRLLPVVRTFISLPAGIARMNVTKFVLFTFIGALPWCYALAYIGVVMGERWNQLRAYFHHVDLVIGVAVAIGVAYFLWSHWPKRQPSTE
ncbi:MAG: DedA family protein [Nitrospiraceae bacterium]|nr:DedA family protein [Nitrospiraceae bacterium]